MKKPFVVHPFLFAIFPILFLFSHNVEQVSFSEILLPSAIVLGFTLLLLLLFRLILRDNKKAGIVVSIFLVLFFSYGHVYAMIRGWQIGNKYLLLTWGMFFTCGAYFTIRTRRELHNFTNIFNIVAFALVAISLINIGVYEFKTSGTWQDNSRSKEDKETNTIDLENAAIFPDIYYIILDGYASSITLKELFGYDNYEFTDYLTEKGFYIASESRSNYLFTYLSLASSLNMEYINYLRDKVGEESKDVTIPTQMIKDNKVMRYLKAQGYKFIHFSSSWGPTNGNNYADLDIHSRNISEFSEMLILMTMLYPFVRNFIESRRKELLDTFQKLAEVPKIEGPKFIFAHILAPHPPYIFGRNGERIYTESTMSNWKPKWQYLDQLIFVNKKVKVLVEKILAQTEILPIIILQADHGVPFSGNQPSEKVFKEKMRIFNAYYLPNISKDLLYDSMTPVNTFRFVFKHYFNADYDLLDDRCYFSDADKSFYKFIDITDKIK